MACSLPYYCESRIAIIIKQTRPTCYYSAYKYLVCNNEHMCSYIAYQHHSSHSFRVTIDTKLPETVSLEEFHTWYVMLGIGNCASYLDLTSTLTRKLELVVTYGQKSQNINAQAARGKY